MNILIIDDLKELVYNLADIFNDEGYIPYKAFNAETAIKISKTNKIDLALVDIKLPDKNGHKLIDNIKKISPETEFVITTGYASMDDAINSVREKMVISYEVKPLNIERLISFVEQVWMRKQAEKELVSNQQELDVIIHNAPDIIFRMDFNLKFIYVNTILLEELNLKEKEIIGKSLDELIMHFNYMNTWKEKMISVFEEEIEKTIEFEIRTGNNIKIFEARITPEVDNTGTISSLFIYARDITDRISTQNKLTELTSKLETRVAERTKQLESANEELEAFTYSASHDLRAPLRSVIGYSNVLKEDFSGDLREEGIKYLEKIIKATNRMSMLIDDLLDLSKITKSEIEYEKINISELFKNIIENYKSENINRKVETQVEENLFIQADKGLINILLDNLINNAWKYTEKEEITIIEFGYRKELNTRDIYYIKDNGAGFDMKYEKQLYNPFTRFHRAKDFPGSGIGLATALRIIKKHGGDIWAKSEIGKGAVFYFTLDKMGKNYAQ